MHDLPSAAVAQRARLLSPVTDMVRLIDGTGDGLPGVFLETFAGHWLVSTTGNSIGYMTVWRSRRNLESHLHGVKVTLWRPAWCRKSYSRMQYTRQRVVVYGSGIDPSSSSHYSITRRDWHAVRRDIGRPDAERRIYRLRTPTRRYKCDQPA